MSATITPDERAAMRERYAADLRSAWDTSAAAHAYALRGLGTSARNDVPRLLDALDTAEQFPDSGPDSFEGSFISTPCNAHADE